MTGGAAAQHGLESIFGDPERGREIAERNCIQCHGLGHGEAGRPLDAPPTFGDFARRGVDRQRLATALTHGTTHTNPPPPLTRFFFTSAQLDDLMAYIDSLGDGG